jgi:hypothetical protein
MIIKELFFKLMYKSRTVEFVADSGRKYIIEYCRTPFWTYENRTVINFFRSKFIWWHGQVWEVFKNGGRCGFSTYCTEGVFVKRKMQKFLVAEVNRLEKIFNKEDNG